MDYTKKFKHLILVPAMLIASVQSFTLSRLAENHFFRALMNAETTIPQVMPKPTNEMDNIWITAYSSTPEETDDTPFITASGTTVRDGIVATNFLPFGTEVRIPELFGDKIFVVEDRMHVRKTNYVDIWMPTKNEALRFGIHQTTILVLE